jgi:hypothetical protein
MDTASDQDPALAKFLTELKSIPWFRHIGKPLPADAAVKQLRQWEDWPGPEEPAIFQLSQRQQALYDDIMTTSEERRAELSRLWDRVHQIVFRLASPVVPYDPERDAWHAPTAAVWQAAWTAGLIALTILLRRPIPTELQEQGNWFRLGHWPSGYTVVWGDDKLGPFLVF